MQATATKTSVAILTTPILNGERGTVGIGGELYFVLDRYSRYDFQSVARGTVSTVYHRGGKPRSCTCKSFKYGGGKPCKHVTAAKELLNQW